MLYIFYCRHYYYACTYCTHVMGLLYNILIEQVAKDASRNDDEGWKGIISEWVLKLLVNLCSGCTIVIKPDCSYLHALLPKYALN